MRNLILLATLPGQYHPRLMDEETETQKGEIHFSKCILWLQVGEAGPESFHSGQEISGQS